MCQVILIKKKLIFFLITISTNGTWFLQTIGKINGVILSILFFFVKLHLYCLEHMFSIYKNEK